MNQPTKPIGRLTPFSPSLPLGRSSGSGHLHPEELPLEASKSLLGETGCLGKGANCSCADFLEVLLEIAPFYFALLMINLWLKCMPVPCFSAASGVRSGDSVWPMPCDCEGEEDDKRWKDRQRDDRRATGLGDNLDWPSIFSAGAPSPRKSATKFVSVSSHRDYSGRI